MFLRYPQDFGTTAARARPTSEEGSQSYCYACRGMPRSDRQTKTCDELLPDARGRLGPKMVEAALRELRRALVASDPSMQGARGLLRTEMLPVLASERPSTREALAALYGAKPWPAEHERHVGELLAILGR